MDAIKLIVCHQLGGWYTYIYIYVYQPLALYIYKPVLCPKRLHSPKWILTVLVFFVSLSLRVQYRLGVLYVLWSDLGVFCADSEEANLFYSRKDKIEPEGDAGRPTLEKKGDFLSKIHVREETEELRSETHCVSVRGSKALRWLATCLGPRVISCVID